MRKTSKVLWIALVVVAMLACTVLGAMASDTSTAVVYGDVVDVSGESTFDVSFKFKENNTDVECGKITLSWDSTKMTAKNIVAGEALAGADFGSKINDDGNGAVIAWAGSSIKENVTDGTLFTVTFDKVAIANGDIAAIDVSVDNFGYVNAFKAVDLAADVAANKAYANSGPVTYNGGDPEAFMNDVLEMAESGADVNVVIASEMAFTKSVKLGTPGTADTAGTVNVTATLENGVPVTGIKVYADVIVGVYGNMYFNDILVGNTQYKYSATLPTTVEAFNKGTGKQSWSSGGCIQFTEGLGVFGHENTGTATAPDYGYIGFYPDVNALKVSEGALVTYSSNYSIHVSGHVEVYTGTYYTITGNFYGSGVTVDSPVLKVAGNASTSYIIGGSHNKLNNPVTGVADIDLLDSAKVTSRLVGGSYLYTNGVNGADIYVNTTGQLNSMVLGCYIGAADTQYDNVLYKAVIDNCTITGDGGILFHRSNAGTAHNSNYSLTINGGRFENLMYFGNDTSESTNSVGINGKAVITINGGTFTKNVYFGSNLSWNKKSSGTTHQAVDSINRTVTINGGSFVSFFGGSFITAPNKSAHRGATDITITNATFSASVYGGSRFETSDATHSGAITMTFQGTTGKMITAGYHIFAGSSFANGTLIKDKDGVVTSADLHQRNYHTGETLLCFKDIVNDNDDTENGPIEGLVNNFVASQKICAGSALEGIADGVVADRNEHKGNSVLLIQRSAIGDRNGRFYGGSRIDGDSAVHSGTSTVIIDGNTGIDAAGNDTPGVGGWAKITDIICGGSCLNGWLDGNFNSFTQYRSATTRIQQTGNSEVQLIGPEDRVDGQYNHMLNIYNRRVFGGAQPSSNVKVRHTYDSQVYIKNYVDAGSDGARISAGPYYSAAIYEGSTVDRVPTSRIIVDGTYEKVVVCGSETVNAPQTYISNTALVMMPGSQLLAAPHTGNYNTYSAVASGGIKQQGDQLIEVYSGALGFVDGSTFSYSVHGKTTYTGRRCLKLIGNFADGSDEDDTYTLRINVGVYYFDLTQFSGPNVDFKTSAGNGAYTETFERINSTKNVLFVDSTSTTSSLNQIEVTPGMKFSELLAVNGMKFYTNYASGVFPRLLSYSNEIKYDSMSTSPNAFEFYLATKDGKLGEKIDTVPADASQKIIVKSGTVYSAPTYLRHVFRVNGASAALKSDISLIFKVNPALMSTYNYSDIKLVVDGETFAEYDEVNGVYEFEYNNYTPNLFGEEKEIVITAKYNGVDVSSQPVKYSVAKYCYNILANSTDDTVKALVIDILNYGAAIQKFKDSNVADADLINAKLTDEQKAYVETKYDTNDKSAVESNDFENPVVKFKGATLGVTSQIDVMYKIEVPAGVDPSTYTAKVVSNGITYTINGSDFQVAKDSKTGAIIENTYWIVFDVLTPDQIDIEMAVTVYEGDTAVSNTLTYSIAAYATTHQNSETEIYKLVAKALANYCRSTAAYVESLEQAA